MDEKIITKGIVESFTKDFLSVVDSDVAIAGAGPAGMTAARYLARKNLKVVVFERNLYVGGGMWAGGILFPKIVIQEAAKELLEEIGVKLEKYQEGCYIADSVETVNKCAASAIDAGAKILIGISTEDVMIRKDRITGVVINWGAVEMARLHVDPVTVAAKYVIDATGHDAEVVRTVQRKMKVKLATVTGEIVGERPMWAEKAEKEIMENTKEIYPGLIVAGMAANAVCGSPRMGPIFGGMLMSGKKAAEIIIEKLK
jgi:thiamine thiazole synthase